MQMGTGAPKRYWVIRQHEGSAVTAEWRVPYGFLSEPQLKRLLERLASRHLTAKEIIVEKRARVRTSLLDGGKDSTGHVFSAGENPHYTASVETASDAR